MASWHVANAFSTRLKLIWPKSSLKKSQNVQNTCFFAKSSGDKWVKLNNKTRDLKSRIPEEIINTVQSFITLVSLYFVLISF